ncbi:MAG TPA: hypothetical protein VGY54_22865 [Polyangiaceae bacterium]|nr:hypothetical protein [Polyangiaceae bacterium]
MTTDFAALRRMLQATADARPPGDYPKWSPIAKAGAAAAERADLGGVKKSCKDCHDMYKQKYKAEFPTRPAHPPVPDDHWL